MNMRVKELIFLAIFACILTLPQIAADLRTLDVIVVGATGDLAKRYLWNALYILAQKERNITDISLYGGAKSKVSNQAFQEIVTESIRCDKSDSQCRKYRSAFVSRCQYEVLKDDADYKRLCTWINLNSSNIIFYLSVPPVAYRGILQSVASHCNITDSSKNFKFAFEKPFGTDFQSSLSLSNLLAKYLSEKQIYRVDHFLSDATIGQISDFRARNPHLERLLNKRYVKRIEVTAVETVGCQGRTSYYDRSGVVRDMLQNHLTEVLCLVTRDMTSEESRLQLMKNISTVTLEDLQLAQYQGYSEEVSIETRKKGSSLATFARARIRITGPKWENVPVWLTSGKQMRQKNVYVRIVFIRNASNSREIGACGSTPQIVFVRCHGDLDTPALLISRGLPISRSYSPPGWIETEKFENVSVFGEKGRCFVAFVPNTTVEHAYTHVIANLFNGNREEFVPTDALLESWRVWTEAAVSADRAQRVTTYPKGSSMKNVVKLISLPLQVQCLISNLFVGRCDVR